MSEVETDVMHDIMIEATRLGHRLMRNNTGIATYRDREGNTTGKVKYGVGGTGAGDLIGWTVRNYVPVFTMIETKNARSTPKENKAARDRREKQQQKIDMVRAAGGVAGFCESVEDYHRLIGYTPEK